MLATKISPSDLYVQDHDAAPTAERRPAHRIVRVPSITGLGSLAASYTLARAGLNDVTSLQPSATVPYGHVIASSPTAGTSVPAGSEVRVVISAGTPLPE